MMMQDLQLVVLVLLSVVHCIGAYTIQPVRILRFPSLKGAVQGASPTLTIRPATDVELPMVASFMASNMYRSAIPNGQRKELSRLELNNLRDTYGRGVGRWRYPSTLYIAKNESAIVGCVGLAFQQFFASRKEFVPVVLPKISQNSFSEQMKSDSLDVSGSDNVVLRMQNLFIDRSYAETGLESSLIDHCEQQAKEWGEPYVYTTAYRDQKECDQLYRNAGYKKYYRSKTTRTVPGKLALEQEKCIYYCYRKGLDEDVLEKMTLLQRIINFVKAKFL